MHYHKVTEGGNLPTGKTGQANNQIIAVGLATDVSTFDKEFGYVDPDP